MPGLLVIISSTVGGGKDSVIRGLLNIFPEAARLVTTTTRAPRPGEIDGIDYHFISVTDFLSLVEKNQFVEHNFLANNYYGIQKIHLEEMLERHPIVLVQADVNGKHNLDRLHIPHLSVFLLPENIDILRSRAAARGGMTPEMIEERVQIGLKEIEAAKDYTYSLVNYQGKLAETIENIAKNIQNRL